jgi:hypothetical protein
MKKLSILLFPILLFFGCSEIAPDLGVGTVNPVPVGTIQKKVLIEKFTGVRCVNCPAGAKAIKEMQEIHGENLIAVSIHTSAQFATPLPESTIDFRIDEGATLLSFLGTPLGFPSGVVDRKLFDGEPELLLGKASWAGYIDQEMSREAEVDIVLDGGINDSGRMNVTADITFLEADPSIQYKFTLMITEDNIVNAQEDVDGIITDYVHMHTLRDIVTPATGQDIASPGTINLTFEDYAIPEDWDRSELNVIAIVHSSNTEKRVLQVEQFEF